MKSTDVVDNQHRADLPIDQDLRLQQRTWVVQRLGWGMIACICVFALLGLLGPGPLASRIIESPQGGFRLEYERFLHYRATTRLRFLLRIPSNSAEEIQLWFDRTFIEHLSVIHIVPLPTRVVGTAERLTYSFRAPDQKEAVLITFTLEPETFGSLSGRVGIERDESLDFHQFIYP